MAAQGNGVTRARSPRLIAILSGEAEQDGVTRTALTELNGEIETASELDAVIELAGSWAPALVVADGDASIDANELAERLGETGSAPLLVLLSEARPPRQLFGSDTAVEHYLCRPFASETLTALARSLIGPAGRTGPAPVQVRRPSFAAARALYVDARRFVAETLAAVREGRPPDVNESRVVAEQIQSALMRSNLLLLRALEPNSPYRLADHCVNVAIIAGRIADGMEYGIADTLRVVQAGLLHDVGMARLPTELLEKEGRLTEEEFDLVKRHPEYGAEIVGKLGDTYQWLRRVVHEEHERARGQGYPRGLVAEDIDPMAQIIAVADIFEAFSHPRTYRSTFTTYDALHKVIGMRDEYLVPDVVDALVNEISIFPLDSFVLLSTGEIGRVVATNPRNMMRPAVETVWDAAWTPIRETRRLDLSSEPEISIVRPLHETEVPIT